MSAIKFRKRLTKFKITIALLKKFGSKGFITVGKVIKICRSSGESNEICIPYMWYAEGHRQPEKGDMYTPYEVRRWTSPSRKGKLTISKLKSSRLSLILVETVPLDIHRYKSQKGASVSEEFALFNWSSVGYIQSTIWSK